MNRTLTTAVALLTLVAVAPAGAQEASVSHTRTRDAADALTEGGLALVWTGGQRDPVRLLAVIVAQTQTSAQGGELYVTASAVAAGRSAPNGLTFSARDGQLETRRAQPGQLYVPAGPAAGGGTLFVPFEPAPPSGAPESILVPDAMIRRAHATRAEEGGSGPAFLDVGERDREHLVGRLAADDGRPFLQVDEAATAAMNVDPFDNADTPDDVPIAPVVRPGPARRVELPRAIANELRRAGDREVVLVAAVENGRAERVTLVDPTPASLTGRIRRSGDGWELATGDGAVSLAQLPPTLAAKLDGQVATVRGLGFMSGELVVLAVDADLEGQPVRVVGLQRDATGRAIATVRRPGVDEDRPVGLDALDFAADGAPRAPTPGLVGSLPASAPAR